MVLIDAIYAGPVQPRALRDRDSAILKHPHSNRVGITRCGIDGDAQADRQNHGGPERALLHYCAGHYAYWRAQFPARAERFQAPGFGENLSSTGLDERQIQIGDVYRLGGCVVQVAQPRTPCWKLNEQFGIADLARRVQDECRCGWFYRVLEPGMIQAGDALQLLEREAHAFTVAATMQAVYHGVDREQLRRLATLESLSPNWRDKAARKLESGQTPTGHQRLTGA